MRKPPKPTLQPLPLSHELDDLKDKAEHPIFQSFKGVSFVERLHKVVTAGLVAIVFTMAGGIYWAVERPSPLNFGRLPFKLVSPDKIYHPGDIVPVIVIRCSAKSKAFTYVVIRGFYNKITDTTEMISAVKATVEPGCSETISKLHQLPKNFAPGTYTIVGMADVPDLFGIKRVTFESDPFKVE